MMVSMVSVGGKQCQAAVVCQCASAVQRDCKHQRPGAMLLLLL
jgi:hypothetical protein